MRRSKFITAVLGSVLIAATMALNVGILNAEGTFTYDVDGNGVVNVMDLIHLKSYLIGEEKLIEPEKTEPKEGQTDYKISKDYIDAIKKIDADDVEIEKKWLIDKDRIPYNLSWVEHVIEIEQTYVCFSPEMRLRKYDSGASYEFTVKSNMRSDGLARDETNIAITEDEYNDIIKNKQGNTIHKTRYQFMDAGQVIAIDIFHGDLDGLAYMEIEFPDFSAAEKYQTPDWVTADVTDDIRYKNGHLARYGIPDREDS